MGFPLGKADQLGRADRPVGATSLLVDRWLAERFGLLLPIGRAALAASGLRAPTKSSICAYFNFNLNLNGQFLPNRHSQTRGLKVSHGSDAFQQPDARRGVRRAGRVAWMGSHAGSDPLRHPDHLHRFLRPDRLPRPLDHHAPEILKGFPEMVSGGWEMGTSHLRSAIFHLP